MNRKKRTLDAIENAIPGFGFSGPGEQVAPELRDPDPARTFTKTGAELRTLLSGRDSVAFLARTGLHLFLQLAKDPTSDSVEGLQQPGAELLQTIALMHPRGPDVPTSPRNMVRAWELAERNIHAYTGSAIPSGSNLSASERVSRQARIQTLFYRNIFSSDDAQEIVPALLAYMDQASLSRLGYRVSDVARALFRFLQLIPDKLDSLRSVPAGFHTGQVDATALERLVSSSTLCRRAWRFANHSRTDPQYRAWVAFQLSELAWAPAFTFSRAELETLFGSGVTGALFRASIGFGELASLETGSIYLDSPIRRRPFIRLSEDALFLPFPAMLVSFPFAIIEGLFEGDTGLSEAYSAARTRYLEDATAALVAKALPSATLYRSVHWTDPDSGKGYENDLVVKLGNHIFLFEAKSGKVNAASRRGGESSLRKNFKRLYVEPGQQAARLETLLRRGESAEALLHDAAGKPIPIDLSKPAIISSFGVCIEHFAAITSTRRNFEEIGLIAPVDPWSPIFSIGELRMITTYLDSEVAFFHYLTRRATIERQLVFMGDEQDLLSLYITNGFLIDSDKLKDMQVFFHRADAPVRGTKQARSDRRTFDTPGLHLPPYWRRLAAGLYTSDTRHQFDMVEAIFNQHPGTLKGMEERARRWNGGMGRATQDPMFAFVEIGSRIFAVALTLERDPYFDAALWHEHARDIAKVVKIQTGATDCLVILRVRKSLAAFDAVSFFRMLPGDIELHARS